MKATGCILVLATITSLAQAGVYNTTSSTVDAGGTAASSASYSQSAGSIGGIVGVSSQTATQETAKNGYVGQLTEVAGMQLTTAPASVNEASTRQLTAAQVLDDATTAVLDPASVAWSVLTGPVTSVSASGLATAGTIYQTTPASVQGIWGGFTATQGLSVINVGVDDYQAYAGDGIDEQPLQLTTVNRILRPSISGIKSARFSPNQLPGRVIIGELFCPHPDGCQRVSEPQFTEFANGVRRQVDADANVPNFACSFEHDNIVAAGGMQAKGGRQSTDPRSCN